MESAHLDTFRSSPDKSSTENVNAVSPVTAWPMYLSYQPPATSIADIIWSLNSEHVNSLPEYTFMFTQVDGKGKVR